MSTDPDQIRDEIRRTRQSLSSDVDALAYKASPARMVQERKDRVRGALQGVRDKVLGTVSDVGEHANAATSALSDTASSVGDTALAAPAKVKGAAEGNPVAAGLIVFGAAWLVSSLLPKSQREQEAAQQVKTAVREHAGPITDAVGQAADQMKDHLREPVEEAVDAVKTSVADAAHSVKDEGVDQAQNVRDDMTDAKDELTSRP